MARITTKTGCAEGGRTPSRSGCSRNGLRKGSKPSVPAITEKAWLGQVTDLAETLGWQTYHPWLSIHSPRGWPDLALWRERLILAELKTDSRNSKLSKAQERTIEGLRAAGVEVHVWRPADLDQVVTVLQARRPKCATAPTG